MAVKGTPSEVGADKPTEKSNQEIDNLVDDVLDSPALAPKSTLPKEDAGLDKEVEEEEADEPAEEAPEGKQAEDSDEESEDDVDEEVKDDEVVPASKHKKILEKMQKRIDKLTAEREAEKLKSAPKTQEDRLQNLSLDELSELRENVDESIIDAKVAAKTEGVDATSRINELKALKKSIDQTIKLAPQRFASKQVEHFNQMVEAVKEIDPEITERKGELFNTAVRVYQRMPSLQRSETGQAEALAIAAEYYLERKSIDNGREKATNLSKKVATLKRKTALDSKTRTGNSEQVSARKLKDVAVKGTFYDKLSYVKSLIPDDFLQH